MPLPAPARRRFICGLALSLGLALLYAAACSPKPEALTLATTTSTYDSGLLDYLLPTFERENRVKVKVVAVGTGQALALGERGDADILLVHSPEAEEKFMAAGFGTDREPVMYNDFVLVGPASDPAGIRGGKEAPGALAQIAQARATFISRGDNSGTYTKERGLWLKAGIQPQGDWYLSVGQGMGEVLNMAREKGAYTLTDRGTFLAQGKPGLEVLVEGDADLFNPYHVITVNPQKHPSVKYKLALKLMAYLISRQTQERIYAFGRDKYSQPLFFPDSREGRALRGK